MTCLSGSHSFQLLTCVLSGDQSTIFILFKRPARPRPFLTIDPAAVHEPRHHVANRDFAESVRESFGDRSGNSQRHQASNVIEIGKTTESASRSRTPDPDYACACIPVSPSFGFRLQYNSSGVCALSRHVQASCSEHGRVPRR